MFEVDENDKEFFRHVSKKTNARYKAIIEEDNDYIFLYSYFFKGNPYAKVIYKPWNMKDITRGIFTVSIKNYDRGTRPHKRPKSVGPGESFLEIKPDISKSILLDDRNNMTDLDLYNVTLKSNVTKVHTTCPHCGAKTDATRDLNHIVRALKQCPICEGGISYGEKYIFNLFKKLGYTVIRQYSKKNARWINTEWKYDLYIVELDMIVEVHGIQHFEDTSFKGYIVIAEEQQERDRQKKKLASGNVKLYIEINASYSDFDWLREHAKKELLDYIDINLSEDEWSEIAIESMKSVKQEAMKMRQEDPTINPSEVAKILGVSTGAVRRWYHELDRIGAVDYKTERIDNNPKKIIGINIYTGERTEPYDSISKAGRALGLDSDGISWALNGKNRSIYEHIWLEYSCYELLQEYEIDEMLEIAKKNNNIKKKQLIMVKDGNRLFTFTSQAKVGEAFDISRSTIKRKIDSGKKLYDHYEIMYI